MVVPMVIGLSNSANVIIAINTNSCAQERRAIRRAAMNGGAHNLRQTGGGDEKTGKESERKENTV